MKSVCEENMCTGCSACIDVCPKNAIVLKDELVHLNAVINEETCIHCGKCEKVCQQIKPIEFKKTTFWTQGWSNNAAERKRSSSGGIAYALAKQTITEGGYVAACCFSDGEFKYDLISSIEKLGIIRGSKYVKSNPEGIYTTILAALKSGKKVLFIGLPCHVAGLRNFIGREYDNLIMVDLVCHGTPSPRLLELFLKQYKLSLKSIIDIHFRRKNDSRLNAENEEHKLSESVSFTEPGIRDRYTMGFLKGLIYTENCYQCQYAKNKRISDITIGDSWGTELDIETKRKGVSLILCQTEKGKLLLDRCGVELFDVDIEKAIASNHQLKAPFSQPAERERFFYLIDKGRSFNKAVSKCYPELCFKTDIKNTMSKLGLRKSGREVIDYRISVEK